MVRLKTLLEAGIGRGAIRRRIEARVLDLMYPGTYRFGAGPLTPLAEAAAAVLACGVNALLSYRSGLEVRGLLEMQPANAWHVTVPERRLRGPSARECVRKGLRPIKVHFTSVLHEDEITEVEGVPVTSVARALIDFASHGDRVDVAHAYEQALIAEAATREELSGSVARHPRRRGVSRVKALLLRDAPPSITRSRAERMLVELLHEAGLTGFRTNVPIGPYRVDVLWEAERVIVEVDGAAFHSTDARREADTRRDAALAARGFVVIRVTWKELVHHPARAISRISRTLGLRAA